MTTHDRPARVGQEIQGAIARLLNKGGIRDPRIGFVTITGVKMSPDLRVARVYYSMLGTDQERADTQAGLDAAKGFVRREVTSEVKLRVSPEVHFVFDPSVETGDKIDRLLREVKDKEGW